MGGSRGLLLDGYGRGLPCDVGDTAEDCRATLRAHFVPLGDASSNLEDSIFGQEGKFSLPTFIEIIDCKTWK